jgi:hypothetical protein
LAVAEEDEIGHLKLLCQAAMGMQVD